ncbi:MAG: bifunctional diguanylate cyclase/phosphodiesterase, partial [Lachnospiraceae bacterium]
HAQTAVSYAVRQRRGAIMAYEADMKSEVKSQRPPCFPQEKKISEKYDMNFLLFAFSLLSHSKDTNSAINLLLERIGTRYDLSCVHILEKDRENHCLIPTNLWEREYGISKDMECVFYEEENEFGEFDQQGSLCVKDCDKNPIKGYESICRHHVKSLIAFSFEDTVLGAGNIYFSDCKRKRKWEEKEKSTLYECGKMISVFVFLRKEHSKDKEQITELLTKDQLTGLLNRKSFETEVKEYVAKTLEGRYALVFSDVNDFEYVNSNFGVEAGNRILYDYARSMEENEGMLLGCRIYSDYFIMLCKGRSRREIEENIRLSDEKFVKNQKKLYPASNLRLSTGICFVESGNVDFDVAAAIENANLARKRAKNQCSNQIEIYKDFFRKEKEHEQRVAGSIHEALRNKKIELFLQPKFSLMTRRMIGAEALVRWRREDGSLRSPVDFIPVLEKVGYIVELDFYMYEQVLIHLRKWRDQGKMIVPISVNFSRRHIQHDDFVKRICGLAERYDIEPGLIEIEITESSISENNQKMLNDMSKLQENGFKVDIDDFGTGYSSLNMLLNAPVDTVKVDKSFLKNIDKSEKERKYIDRLAHLINAAEKEIIFEGVETEHQAKILTECGYTMAQGYLFGKPIPAEEFDHTYMVQEKNYAVSM